MPKAAASHAGAAPEADESYVLPEIPTLRFAVRLVVRRQPLPGSPQFYLNFSPTRVELTRVAKGLVGPRRTDGLSDASLVHRNVGEQL